MQAGDYVSGRRYGLDWLRIGAFALLILYHIGMFFVEWDWHVKTASPVGWVELPMLALNPWRLTLLFLVSGVASRALLAKSAGSGGFVRDRSKRLLIPLIAGMALFVAPQPWVELQEKAGYADGFLHFWTQDYFEFGASTGLSLPTWNHLWFVAYLWVYTTLFALLGLAPAGRRAAAQRAFQRLFSGWRLFALPLAFLIGTRMLLFPHFPPTNALFDDVYNHAVYGFAFLFGAGLARAQGLWETIVRHWKGAAAAALLGWAVYAGIVMQEGDPDTVGRTAARIARSVQAWGAILALLGAAQLFLHKDGPARRYLTDAVFPYYIAHQTIIVLAGFWLKPLGIGPGAEFAVILAATVAGCALTYEAVRRVRWLRPLFGLKPLATARAETCQARDARAAA
jgi:glucans biosynthesis protein C